MNFTIGVAPFLKAIRMGEAVARRSNIIEVLKYLRIHVENGVVNVLGSDQECYVDTVVPCPEIGEEGTVLLDAKRLLGFLGSFKSDKGALVTIGTSKSTTFITTDEGKFKLYHRNADDFPTVNRNYRVVGAISKTSTFLGMLDAVLFSSMWDGSTAMLQSVFMRFGDDVAEFCTTDRRRGAIATCPLEECDQTTGFLMSNRACELYLKVLDRGDDDPLTIGYADGQLVLDNGKVIITTQAIEGEWPYEGFKSKFFDMSNHTSVLMRGDVLSAALGRAALVSGEARTPIADVTIADGTVNVKTDETATYGGCDESFSCKGDTESNVKVLIRFVQDSIDKATSGEIRFHVAGPKMPIYIGGEHVDESKLPFTTISGIMPIVQRADVAKEGDADAPA